MTDTTELIKLINALNNLVDEKIEKRTKRIIRVKCPCGKLINPTYKKSHFKSRRHKEYLIDTMTEYIMSM